jgi:excisionase family DNA binding protein
MSELSEYVTTREAADILKVSKARVDQFCRSGRLKFTTVGNARLILRADVVAFKAAPRAPGAPKKSKGEEG